MQGTVESSDPKDWKTHLNPLGSLDDYVLETLRADVDGQPMNLQYHIHVLTCDRCRSYALGRYQSYAQFMVNGVTKRSEIRRKVGKRAVDRFTSLLTFLQGRTCEE